jgi:hypothetical protein
MATYASCIFGLNRFRGIACQLVMTLGPKFAGAQNLARIP